MQREFVRKAVEKLSSRSEIIGVAVGGSWITNDLDEFSDVDLIVVSEKQIAGDVSLMQSYAELLGNLLHGFTGEHVGEPRVLICLYDEPLLHVDIKFLKPEEFYHRVENPVILWERDNRLSKIISSTVAKWPALDFQWIEDRFWIWIHYAALKLGRGENFEALDFLSFLRGVVLSPLLQLKQKQLPRGLRKIEFTFPASDLASLKNTIPEYNPESIYSALENAVALYRELRHQLFPASIIYRQQAETKALSYLAAVRNRKS